MTEHPDFAFKRLTGVFNHAFRWWPELLEPYVNRLAIDDRDQQTEIMREGLRDTFKQRYPEPETQRTGVQNVSQDQTQVQRINRARYDSKAGEGYRDPSGG